MFAPGINPTLHKPASELLPAGLPALRWRAQLGFQRRLMDTQNRDQNSDHHQAGRYDIKHPGIVAYQIGGGGALADSTKQPRGQPKATLLARRVNPPPKPGASPRCFSGTRSGTRL